MDDITVNIPIKQYEELVKNSNKGKEYLEKIHNLEKSATVLRFCNNTDTEWYLIISKDEAMELMNKEIIKAKQETIEANNKIKLLKQQVAMLSIP